LISIDNYSLLGGALPPNALGLIAEWAEIPLIPGCETAGETFEELLSNQ